MLKHLKASDEWSEKSLGAKGFTLIELLVVVVILGILAAVVVFAVSGIRNDAQNNACKTESRTLATAVEAYYAQYGGYPSSEATLKSAGLIRDLPSNYTVSGSAVTATGKC
jgi:type II secretion system protein G